jgi:hypothetical protein
LRDIGLALHALYQESKTLESESMIDKVSPSINSLQGIEEDLKHSEDEIARLRKEFRDAAPGAKIPPEAEDEKADETEKK